MVYKQLSKNRLRKKSKRLRNTSKKCIFRNRKSRSRKKNYKLNRLFGGNITSHGQLHRPIFKMKQDN